MNRRWFLKGLAGAGAAVAISSELIEALKPKSTIFLPPKFGWHPYQPGNGYIREVIDIWSLCEVYNINFYGSATADEMRYRYDAIGRDIWGYEEQFCVETKRPDVDLARMLIADRFKQNGRIAIPPKEGRQFHLSLPPNDRRARYV